MTRLRLWREDRNLTQEEAATALGISRASYIPLERGLSHPSRGMMAALERVFGDRAASMLKPIRSKALA